MTPDTKIAVSDDVVSREVGGEAVLLNLASGEYFGLDEVGTRIWELLSDQARSLEELSVTIADEYDAPLNLIEADILALAGELRDAALVSPVSD